MFHSMVELTSEDFKKIFVWSERCWGLKEVESIPNADKKVFWKLTFLAEDQIKEEKQEEVDT